MAIYHFHSKAITRKETEGKTAVAAAAYRNAERYKGVDDIVVNYKRKQSNGNELIYPRHVKNRITAEELWRSADTAELKLDGSFKKVSRSAREFEFSLMQELTPIQNKAAARDFARIFSEKYGVACNIAFHQLENKNPHCHMMFTVRKIEADGTLSDKIREIDNINMMLEARKKWAEIANKHLMYAGFDITISEKSYKDQGIEHEPTKHINNKKLKRAERKGIELPETIRNAALMRMRSSNDDQYQTQDDDVKKNGSDDVVDDSTHQSTAVSMPVEAFEEFQPSPTLSPAQKLHYEGLSRQELAQRAAEDVALLKMKQKLDDDLRAIDEHYDRLKKLHEEIQNSKGIKVKRKFFGFLTLHVMKYKDADIEALKQEYIEGKIAFEENKHAYERRMRASGIAVLGEHIKYVEENIDYIRSVTNEKMIREFTKAYIDGLDNNSNGSDFVYVPKTNQGNTVTPSNDYDYNHAYNPDDHDDVDGTNGPR